MRRVIVLLVVVTGIGAALLLPRSRAARAQSYGPDVTTTGQAYSCGDGAGSPDTNAFDDSTSSVWASSQTGTDVAGHACIGQHFTGTYDIRQISIKQGSTAGNRVLSVYWQESDDGATWHTVSQLTLPNDDNVNTFSDLPISGLHSYWRLLAAQNTTDAAHVWAAVEIQMMEAIGNPSATPVYTATAPSATPTITLTPSTTPSPTPNLDVIITSTYGPSARFVRSADIGSMFSFLIQAAVFGLLIIWFAVWFWGRRNA